MLLELLEQVVAPLYSLVIGLKWLCWWVGFIISILLLEMLFALFSALAFTSSLR